MGSTSNIRVEIIEQRIESLKHQRDVINQEICLAEKDLALAKEDLAKTVETIADEQPEYIFELEAINTHPIVSKSSPIEAKYELFHELFSGRPDVHAHRFENDKKGTCGYVPACMNERNWNVCKRGARGKERVRCVDCEQPAFYPINMDAFIKHISGGAKGNSDVLGAYPIDTNGLCKFVLADFDEESRKEKIDDATAENSPTKPMSEAALSFCRVCWMNSVPVYLERSRSGKGLHVWLFFTEPVAVKFARRLFTALLTKAMSENSAISFSSYDMLIPRQDTISKFGFGNLVALPLQGKAGKNRNSLFINESMQHYPDQWEFLSSIRKVSPTELDVLLARLLPADELGELVHNEDNEELLVKPWEKRKPEIKLAASDFSGALTIIRANMLHIEKKQLTARAANKIKRLAAFRNPDFYKHQNMRLETWDKPRVISSVEETAEYLSIPRGCEDALIKLLKSTGIEFSITDKTESGRPIDAKFVFNLRDKQLPAAKALLEHNYGVLSAPTGFGKTVLGAYLIAHRAVSTLVLVPNHQLHTQWLEALRMTLDIKDEAPEKRTPKGRKKKVEVIGQFSGLKKNTSGIVDVATIQSLHSNKTGEVQDFIKDYGLVIVDECHHVPASSFEPVLKHVNAKYVYGLTATPFREDGHHAIIFLECGPIRYKVDAKEQAQQRPFEHYLIPRFTNMLPSSIENESSYSRTLGYIGRDEQRNQMIIKDVMAAINSGRKPLVLTERTEHVQELAKLLENSCDKVITLMGSKSNKDKRADTEQLSALKPDDKFVIIATGRYVGEGFDFPMLDTLFITMPISYKGKVTQYIGRLHRLFEGKGDVYVYDYVDASIPQMEKIYHKRITGYRDNGYKTVISQDVTASGEIIFDKNNYWSNLTNDIAQANKEFVISSPQLVGFQIEKLLKEITEPLLKKVVITVITKPISEYKEAAQEAATLCIERLKDAGVKVVEKPGAHQQFAVLDKSTVWYGSVAPLGYVTKDASALRFVKSDIAEQLLQLAFQGSFKDQTPP